MAQNCGKTAKPKRKAGGRPFGPGADPRRNLGGRPKGLGHYIREKLGDDGQAIADFAMSVLRYDPVNDKTPDFPILFGEKRWAAEFLRDTGWGRPGAMQEEGERPPEDAPKAVDPRRLTDEQMRVMDEVEAMASGGNENPKRGGDAGLQ